jgi:hypothetical protein
VALPSHGTRQPSKIRDVDFKPGALRLASALAFGGGLSLLRPRAVRFELFRPRLPQLLRQLCERHAGIASAFGPFSAHLQASFRKEERVKDAKAGAADYEAAARAVAAKTARLRALRLAKEAADKVEEAANPVKPTEANGSFNFLNSTPTD